MEPATVWQQFTTKLASGELSEEDCLPVHGVRYGEILINPDWSDLKDTIVNAELPVFETGEHLLIARVNAGQPQ